MLPSIKQEMELPKESSIHYHTLRRIKQVCQWFPTWLPWQRRVFVCRLMEHCSREQLELLATSLEPLLHLDFSTSLGPHLQALHLDRAATFHVERNLVQNVLNPLPSMTSWAKLESLPHTNSDGDSLVRRSKPPSARQKNAKKNAKKECGVILPALPLTHPQHETSRSIEDIITLRRQRFSSIPDFRSTADLLRNVRHKELLKTSSRTRQRSKSLGGPSNEELRQAESFKNQLISLSEWVKDWESTHRATLLLEVVKKCDKDLLGYFVQCLHQRLRESAVVDTLSDGILLKIFSYLTPLALCRAAQTCKRWNKLACHPSLWKYQCHALSVREGVGDLSRAVEIAFGHSLGEDDKVDWKKMYRDLSAVMARLKKMVLKVAKAEIQAKTGVRRQASSSFIQRSFTLQQMLRMLRASTTPGSRPTTVRDLVLSAPEAPASARRRARAEKLEAYIKNEQLETERRLSSRYRHRKPGEQSRAQSTNFVQTEQIEMWRSKIIVDSPVMEALDIRPYTLLLPDPDGIECLVLSGELSDRIKPGKVYPIPKVTILPKFLSPVQCLQCDQKKIVAGTANREILVRDIRSGRPVQTLTGHKGSVQCLQYDNYKIVSGSWDTMCIVWDAVHFEPLTELRGHTACVSCLQFTEDYLVTGSHDKSVRVWSTSTWECVAVIGEAHSGPVLCLQFNQRVIASGGADKTVRLWSPSSYHLLHTLTHDADISSLCLANALLITASLSGDVLLWNVNSGNLILEMRHTSGTHMLGISLASERLYGAGSDGVLYEWSVCSGTCVRRLVGHSSGLTSVWAGNGKIVTAAEDSTMCVWYTKKAVAKELEEDDLTSANIDSFYTELPIRVITEERRISH